MKDKLTNIIAVVLAAGTSINAYLQTIPEGGEINWVHLVGGLLMAIIAFFTGKDDNGKKKV